MGKCIGVKAMLDGCNGQSKACNGQSWQSNRQICPGHNKARDWFCQGHNKAIPPEQVEVEVQVEGAQVLTTLVKVPSCVSVAVAPSSQGTAVVGATPVAQAVYVEYCFTFTVAGKAVVVSSAMVGAVLVLVVLTVVKQTPYVLHVAATGHNTAAVVQDGRDLMCKVSVMLAL